MLRHLFLLGLFFLVLAVTTDRAVAQVEVYNNLENFGNSSVGFGSQVTMWDDLQLTQGGLLSEISFIARPPSSSGQIASGVIDLRVFDETFNRPQGDPLGTIPFSGTFQTDPNDFFNQRLVIDLPNLESLGINLPTTGRIGAGIRFDNNSWFFPDAGTPELGSSPGGNWLDNSSFERNDVNGLGWSVKVVDPAGVGPGVGSYNLFETALATPNHPTSNSGNGINAGFYSSIGFRVKRTTHLKEVGGWIGGSGTIFAAVVDLDGNQFGVPDLSGDDVVGTTLIDLNGTSFTGQNVSGDLDLTLEPGVYALVFGADKFGADADGDGLHRHNHIPNGNWTSSILRQSDGARFFQSGTNRVFAIADSAPGTVQIRPSFDTLAEVTHNSTTGNVEGVRLIDGDSTLEVNTPSTAGDPDQVAVLEFSLENVPTNRDLLAVTLELDLFFAGTSPPTQFEVFGYAGNGAADRQDAEGQQMVVGVTNIDSSGITTIDIDPTFISGLIGNASHLGLTIVPDSSGFFSFRTLEGGESGEPPLLTINLGLAPESGDYNGDGTVNAADYTIWRDTVGSTTDLRADGNGDLVVDSGDYDVWKNQFGFSASGSSTQSQYASIPEPSTACLTFFVSTILTVIRARQNAS